MPGRHNVLNALAALGSGHALGRSARRDGARARGVRRRRAALPAARRGARRVRRRRLRASSRRRSARRSPRRARRIPGGGSSPRSSRTSTRARATSRGEFGGALAGADVIYLTEIYGAREKPIAGVTAALIDDAARDAGRAVTWRGERDALAAALAAGTEPGDVVMTLGAGDITRTGPELLALLSARAMTRAPRDPRRRFAWRAVGIGAASARAVSLRRGGGRRSSRTSTFFRVRTSRSRAIAILQPEDVVEAASGRHDHQRVDRSR